MRIIFGSGPCASEKSAKIIDHIGLLLDASCVRRSGTNLGNQLSFIGRFIPARSRLGFRSRAITYTDPTQVIWIDFFTLFSIAWLWLVRPKSAAALQWALGCVLASYSERMRTMTTVRPPVSRWVLLVEMLAFFSFPTLGLFAVLANLATISGLDVAWLFSVAILGPIGLAVGFKAVVLNRPSLSKPLTWALAVLAAWTLVAYLLYMFSRSGGTWTSLDWWRGYILIALLPALGTAHLIYLARSAKATPLFHITP
jgi:hypothetical protein